MSLKFFIVFKFIFRSEPDPLEKKSKKVFIMCSRGKQISLLYLKYLYQVYKDHDIITKNLCLTEWSSKYFFGGLYNDFSYVAFVFQIQKDFYMLLDNTDSFWFFFFFRKIYISCTSILAVLVFVFFRKILITFESLFFLLNPFFIISVF